MARLRPLGTKTPPALFLGSKVAAHTCPAYTDRECTAQQFLSERKKTPMEKKTDCSVLGCVSKIKAESFCESFTASCPISLFVHLIEWFGSLSVLYQPRRATVLEHSCETEERVLRSKTPAALAEALNGGGAFRA
jgi:hypothetical protein